MNKRFSKKLYAENDAAARALVKKYAPIWFGAEARDNPDPYGVDLIVYNNVDVIGYIECEVKQVWTT